MRSRALVCVAVFVGIVGCGHAPDERTSSSVAAIVGGSLDTTHRSVVAVVSLDSLSNPTTGETCTGTIVSVQGDTAYVLTAAHCFDKTATMTTVVVTADDYATDKFADGHPVTDHVLHPAFAESVHLFDFAMLKFTGATGLPSTPPLSVADDDLATGSSVSMVGYGFTLDDLTTTDPDASANTSRRSVTVPLDVVGADQLLVDETVTHGGQCQGDSGGPLLYTKGGTDFIAGVVSAGTASCTGEGESDRVSPVVDSFIMPYVNGQPISTAPTCDTCQATATVSGGPCDAAVTACANSADCSNLSVCDAKCPDGDDDCTNACDAQFPAGVDDYDAVSSCTDSSCGAYCADAGAADAGATDDAAGGSSSSSGCSVSRRGGRSTGDFGFGLVGLALAAIARGRRRKPQFRVR